MAGATSAMAAPAGWVHLSAAGLSLDAPQGSTLRLVAPGTWELHNRDLTLGIAAGPKVADADDGEPRRCYATTILPSETIGGVLRTTRPGALADCPEGYASLYMPPRRPGGSAVFVWAWDEAPDGFASVETVIRSIRFSSGP
jgi:hypothetical protein